MQIINLSSKTLKYQTKGTVVVINPGENEIKNDPVLIKKLKDCYGRIIRIVDEAKIAETYNAFSGNAKPVEPPIKEELNVEPVIEDKPIEPEVDVPEVKEEPVVEDKPEETAEVNTTEEITEPEVEVPEVKEEVEEPKTSKKSNKNKGSKKNK